MPETGLQTQNESKTKQFFKPIYFHVNPSLAHSHTMLTYNLPLKFQEFWICHCLCLLLCIDRRFSVSFFFFITSFQFRFQFVFTPFNEVTLVMFCLYLYEFMTHKTSKFYNNNNNSSKCTMYINTIRLVRRFLFKFILSIKIVKHFVEYWPFGEFPAITSHVRHK